MADVFDILTVETDLRMAIHAAFKEAGIEIPFPQQDIHIRSGMPGDIRAVAEAMRPRQENGDSVDAPPEAKPEGSNKPGGNA